MASHAATMLAAIESVIEGRVSADIESYSIAGRQITKIPFAQLIIYRDRYKAEVKREEDEERLKMGLKTKKKIKVRF